MKPDEAQAIGEDALMAGFDLLENFGRYGSCRVPVTVMAGTADMLANPLHGCLLAAALPNARLNMLPGLDHMIHHAAPERVAAAVREIAERDDGRSM